MFPLTAKNSPGAIYLAPAARPYKAPVRPVCRFYSVIMQGYAETQKTLKKALRRSEEKRIKITGTLCRSGGAAGPVAGDPIGGACLYLDKEKPPGCCLAACVIVQRYMNNHRLQSKRRRFLEK